jgi:L-gulonate 5-dehydrogenase
MRAAVMKGPGELAVGDWETPRPGPGEVLVQVEAAGICAGDIAIYQGRNSYARYPQICGHEMAGRVVEVGEEVSGVSSGDAVVVEPFIGCGRCYACRIGKPNCCPQLTILGVNRAGGYAEYVTAPRANVHAIPAGLSARVAALAEPVAIAVQACRRGSVTADDLVLVLGCGPIGLAAIDVARARGATVLAADRLPARMEAAESLGAEVLPAGDGLLAEVLRRTGGDGVPVIIEATGSPQAIESTMPLVAAGGRIVVLGLIKEGVAVTFPGLDLTRKEPTIVGSRASVDCFPESLDLIARGKIQLPRFVSELSMWDAPAIFASLSRDATSLQKGLLIT